MTDGSSRRWCDPWRSNATPRIKALKLDRIELADVTGGPETMAAAVHGQIGRLPGAVPVEEIARALDITEIRKAELDGCEGVLVTDRRRNYGRILVNTRGGPGRARFSIGHELGHFLLENHVLSGTTGFVCDRSDMRQSRALNPHQRQELEANSFAIELLAPRYRLGSYLLGEPELRVAQQMRRDLDISLEAAGRRYVDLHEEPLAAVMTRGGIVRYAVRQENFPWIKLQSGDRIAPITQAHRAIAAGRPGFTRFTETVSAAWIRNSDIELFEQTRLARDGSAVTLLWASASGKVDEDDQGVEELDQPRFDK